MRVNPLFQRFNGGIISHRALGRTDIELLPACAVEQVNWLSKARGEMQFRPGFERMGAGAAGRLLGVKYDSDFSAILDLRDEEIRFWGHDGTATTRATPGFSVGDGDFGSSSSWTLSSAGASTAVITSGKLNLTARRHDVPTARQQITASAGTHYLRITVSRGPVRFRAGSTAGDADYSATAYLRTGVHDLAVINTSADFWIELASEDENVLRLVDSIEASSAGALALSTPWPSAILRELWFGRNLDVHYTTHVDYQTRRIERRPSNGWGVALYESDSGPLEQVFDRRITLTLGAKYGNTTLTASDVLFREEHVGLVVELTHGGQSKTV